jgi:hypothetical protein
MRYKHLNGAALHVRPIISTCWSAQCPDNTVNESIEQKKLGQLILDLGQQGRWRKVMTALDDARQKRTPLNLFIYTAAVNALGRSYQFEFASQAQRTHQAQRL